MGLERDGREVSFRKGEGNVFVRIIVFFKEILRGDFTGRDGVFYFSRFGDICF